MLCVLKNKNIIKISFLLLTITLVFITNNMLSNKEVEKVKEENKVSKKQFAMYVKDSTDDSYTEYTDSELFPNSTKYSFNVTESYCIDNKDNIVSNAISYSNGKVTVTSNKTIYCYLYFDGNLFDIETDILVEKEDGSYKSVSETPTTNENYNYSVRYDCTDNNGIISFGYDYINHKYRIISNTKNKCNIYFEEMIPDIKIIIYINGKEVSEIPTTSSYRLNETLSTCTNSVATVSYNDTTKKVRVKSNKTTICNVYLEGV